MKKTFTLFEMNDEKMRYLSLLFDYRFIIFTAPKTQNSCGQKVCPERIKKRQKSQLPESNQGPFDIFHHYSQMLYQLS
jgi:hypothetical protein